MALHDLLAAFEGDENLPVDLNRVAEWIIAQGIQDEIKFVGVALDVGVIRGFLYRHRYQRAVYGEPVCAADIYYDRNQGEDWVNIVCAKELTHLMDGNHSVKRKEQFDNLLKRLILPNDLKHILEDPTYAIFDRLGDAFAAALLLPMAARAELLPAYQKDEIKASDIAKMAVMPVHYVRMVMHERWDATYQRLMEIQS